jgi:hypothetical protein
VNMTRKNLYFPAQLLIRIKAHRHITGETLSSVVRRAVDEYLKREGL